MKRVALFVMLFPLFCVGVLWVADRMTVIPQSEPLTWEQCEELNLICS